MKTHKVIDLVYHEDEGNTCFVGTKKECDDFKSEQNTIGIEVVPLVGQEIIIENYVLEYCEDCIQMTNHYKDQCQKCKPTRI